MANARQFLVARTAAWAKSAPHEVLNHIRIHPYAYFDTGFEFDVLTDTLTFDFAVCSLNAAWDTYCGATSSNSSVLYYSVRRYNQTSNFAFSYNYNYTGPALSLNQKVRSWDEIEGTNRYVYIDDRSTTFSLVRQGTAHVLYPIYIGALNDNGTPAVYASDFLFYGMQFFRSGVKVHDYVPVRKDGELCIFDSMTGEYLHKLGTGSVTED